MMSSLYAKKRVQLEMNMVFVLRLTPTFRQTENIKIHEHHHPSVLYSIVIGDARKPCDDIRISETCLDDILYKIKKKILPHDEI